MLVGPAFSVEVVVITVAFVKQQMQHRGQADDQQVQGTENLGIYRMSVQLVPNGSFVLSL